MEIITSIEDLQSKIADLTEADDAKSSYFVTVQIIGDELIEYAAKECKCEEIIPYQKATEINTEKVREMPYTTISLDMNNGKFSYPKLHHIEKRYCFAVTNEGATIYLFPYRKNGKSVLYMCDSVNYTYLPPEWLVSHPMPNKIGTFTEKKICEWADFLVKRQAAAYSNQYDCQHCFDKFVEDLMARGYKPHIITPHELGEVFANGLKMRFFVITRPVVNTDITLRVRTQGIETFDALAHNNYKE